MAKNLMELTDALIRGLAPNPDKDVNASDTIVPGMRLKITPKGKRVLSFQYIAPDGRQRKLPLGIAPPTTVKQARLRAIKAAALLADGIDPQVMEDAVKLSPTLRSAFDLYEQKHIKPNLKDATVLEYRRMFDSYIPERLKKRKLISIKRVDIADLIGEMRKTPYQANRLRALLKAFFGWCEGDGGLLPPRTSPVHNIRGYSERKRAFLFDAASLTRLGATLKAAEATEWPPAIMAIRLLLLSGLRKNEVLQLRWAEVDLPNRCLRLSDTKTGAREVPLGAGAIALLEGLEPMRSAMPSEFVFPSPKDRAKPFVGLQKVWERIRKKAGIGNVRIHDLRHNFGGVGATRVSAVHVKGLLGHSQLSTTDRYMNLDHKPLHDAADAVSQDIADALEPTNVVHLGDKS